MADRPVHRGLTLQVHVTDIDAGQRFYAALFGRPPDFAPHEDFVEWRVLAEVELWWQIVVTAADRPLHNRVRFLVQDVHAAARWARETLEVAPTAVSALPGVVAFTDFQDPWQNDIGFYQDLAPSDAQPEPGGSVHDETLFARHRRPVTDFHPIIYVSDQYAEREFYALFGFTTRYEGPEFPGFLAVESGSAVIGLSHRNAPTPDDRGVRWQFLVDDVDAILAVCQDNQVDHELIVEEGGSTHRTRIVRVVSPGGVTIWFEGPNEAG